MLRRLGAREHRGGECHSLVTDNDDSGLGTLVPFLFNLAVTILRKPHDGCGKVVGLLNFAGKVLDRVEDAFQYRIGFVRSPLK